jgi:hypothetical protein
MSDDNSNLVADEAKRLLGSDGAELAGLSDAEIRRFVVSELLHPPISCNDQYVSSAFVELVQGDSSFVRERYWQRRKLLADATPAGEA